MASIIPLSRDPLLFSGVKSQLFAASTSDYKAGRQKPVPESLLNSLFRRPGGGGGGLNILTTAASSQPASVSPSYETGSSLDQLQRPLVSLKTNEVEELSFAHFLSPRKPRRPSQPAVSQSHDVATSRPSRPSLAASVDNGEYEDADDRGSVAASRDTSGERSTRSRSQTLSEGATDNKHAKSASRQSSIVDEVGIPLVAKRSRCHTTSSSSELPDPSNTTTTQPSQVGVVVSLTSTVVVYDDPLVSYNPRLLDDPMIPQITANRKVFTFSGYMTSVLGYRRPNEYKRSINREFHQRFPNIQLTLTKMRSIKLVLLTIALRMKLDLWIVAHAFVLFEKIILKQFICKSNRKQCAAAAMLISAKLNDIKGAALPQLLQELENDFRINRREMLHMELAAFVGLEFSVLPPDADISSHFIRINQSLGLLTQTDAAAAPRAVLPHSLEHRGTQLAPLRTV